MSAAGERKPDREGYLGFKEAIDSGNDALDRRAGALWWVEKPPKSELTHYYDLYLTEGFVRKHFDQFNCDVIEAYASKGMSSIRDPILREKIAKRVERLSEAWSSVKLTDLPNYTKHGASKARVAARQAEHPSETESQAWFKVKREAAGKYLDHLDHLQEKFERAVGRQIGRALGSEASIQAATALDRARQASATYQQQHQQLKPSKDLDRER